MRIPSVIRWTCMAVLVAAPGLVAASCGGSGGGGIFTTPDGSMGNEDGSSGSSSGGFNGDGSLFHETGSGDSGNHGTCVPRTCASAGYTCGMNGDGCGGVLNCGTCKAPEFCGGGGYSKCGGVAQQPDGAIACVPYTCQNAPGGPYDCGVVGDGCGGLTANCGGCVLPNICGGGGKPNQCGDSNAPDSGTGNCTGLCGQIPTCDAGTNTTTITGRVYAPTDPTQGYGAPDPIQHAHVFIPNDPSSLTTFGAQVACACDSASGPAIASTYSAIDGTFTLTNVPAGNNIPVVIQLGRWRRVFYTNVTACATAPSPGTPGVNSLTDDNACRTGTGCNTRLPRKQAEFNMFDNIPSIAVATGSADPIECVLPKLGIDASQFSAGGGAGRVQIYQGNGATMAGAPTEATLTGSTSNLEAHDLVILDCWGGEYDQTAQALANVQAYANAGGRIYASHYSYVWAFTNDPWGCGGSSTVPTATCTTAQHTVADWYVDQAAPGGTSATIDDATMLSWLSQPLINVVTGGTINLQQQRHDVNGVVAPPAQLYAHVTGSTTEPLEFTWNTPPYAAPANQCGRVLFSDFHVNTGGTGGGTFPGSCNGAAPMTPQEKVMEFMLFDLGDCVQQITPPPPPTCTKLTCANYPGVCGVQSDGCGGVTANCNPCTAPQVCGGGGPGKCGLPDAGKCVPDTCQKLGILCGPAGDGCGGLLQCGNCMSPQTCGGGGTPGVCGGGGGAQ